MGEVWGNMARVALQNVMALCLIGLSDGLSPVLPCVQCSSSSTLRSAPTMKVFDWKTRGQPPPELETLTLGSLKAAPGSAHRTKRKGRGISAGQGKSCGFGDRGQKSRSGSPTRPGFEGGQIPLYRRLPKFVGRPTGAGHSKTTYEIVKVSSLNKMPEGSEVDYASLLEARAISKAKYKICKVVGGAEKLSVKGLTVKAHAFTASAREEIEQSGGNCVMLSQPTHKPLDAEAAPVE